MTESDGSGARPFGVLAQLSAELASVVRSASRVLASIETGKGTVSGFVFGPGVLVIAARPDCRDIASVACTLAGGRTAGGDRLRLPEDARFAAFRMTEPHATPLPAADDPLEPGGLALVLGAAADASPIVHLPIISRTGSEGATLDLLAHPRIPGAPIIDTSGRLLGMALEGPDGDIVLLEYATIARTLPSARPGWIGAVFQPTAVPRGQARQTSARLVVRVAPGGPADRAGIVIGDVVLSLDDMSTSGPGAVRGFLATARVGQTVSVRVLHRDRIDTVLLTVAADPDIADEIAGPPLSLSQTRP